MPPAGRVGRRQSFMQLASSALSAASAAASPKPLVSRRLTTRGLADAASGRATKRAVPEYEALSRAVLGEIASDVVKPDADEVAYVEVSAVAGPALLELHCLWSRGLHATSIVASSPCTLLLLNRSLINLLRGIVPAAVDGAWCSVRVCVCVCVCLCVCVIFCTVVWFVDTADGVG